jgi:S1-C subfamily serine protease
VAKDRAEAAQWYRKAADQAFPGAQIELKAALVNVRMGFKFDDNGGTSIINVANGSPAAKAGLRANDVIMELDGRKIANRDDYFAQLVTKKPGDRVAVKVRRNTQLTTIQVTLEKRPD